MKTSNKILLIFFVAAILMMTAVHLTLYAKYKKGEVSSFEEMREGRFEDHSLPAIKYVSVTGFRRCNIIPDTQSKIRIFNKSTQLSYKIVNDTLVIKADSTIAKEDYEHRNVGRQAINLYLPGVVKVNAYYTWLILNGGTDTTAAVSCSVNLSNRSSLTVGDWGGKPGFFNRLEVKTNSSDAVLTDRAIINELSLQADKSNIDSRSAVKHLQLQMDDQSTIVFHGNTLKDINVIKK